MTTNPAQHAAHELPLADRLVSRARASAYADGWRFPSKTRADGRDSVRHRDLCPACQTQ